MCNFVYPIQKTMPLKKFFAILLSLSVLFSTTVFFTVAMDYCSMKKTTSYSLSAKKSCCCKKANTSKCCKKNIIEIKQLKNDCNTPLSYHKISVRELSVYALAGIFTNPFINNHPSMQALVFLHHPPPEQFISRSILFHSLLV